MRANLLLRGMPAGYDDNYDGSTEQLIEPQRPRRAQRRNEEQINK
jgi:hypothetical protein